jgi:hypothetical protein
MQGTVASSLGLSSYCMVPYKYISDVRNGRLTSPFTLPLQVRPLATVGPRQLCSRSTSYCHVHGGSSRHDVDVVAAAGELTGVLLEPSRLCWLLLCCLPLHAFAGTTPDTYACLLQDESVDEPPLFATTSSFTTIHGFVVPLVGPPGPGALVAAAPAEADPQAAGAASAQRASSLRVRIPSCSEKCGAAVGWTGLLESSRWVPGSW